MTQGVVSCHPMQMRASLTILILFFTDSTSSIGCLPKCRVTIYCMKDFVNTSQKMWTYKISKQGTIRCQHNQMRAITPQYIVYNRTFLHNEQRRSIILQGEFHVRHRNLMDVYAIDLGSRLLCTETLLYMAKDASCGVVMIHPAGNGVTYYELRVRNAYIATVPDRHCGSHFCRVAGSGVFTYRPDCKNMTMPR
nr:uncharacterized protein LOC119165555 [Rhipicephalus microplus]